ncbi:MAG: Rz1-like lysis system protein LysC [Aeromonas sp.]
MPLPSGLIPHCPEPAFIGTTFGDAALFAAQLQTTLRHCNAQIATLTRWYAQQESTQ